MTSKHLVDPDLLPVFEQMPPFQFDATMLTNPSLLEPTRAMLAAMFAANNLPLRSDVERSEIHIPGPRAAPEVRVVVIRPKAKGAHRPAILHVHGGGFVMGAPEMNQASHAEYVGELGAVVVSVDYRLPPQTPHPGPIEDCYAALSWLHANADELGVDRKRIAISGESAGGGLAAALALLARDRKEVPIAFQHLIFPMLDDRTASGIDRSSFVGEFGWTREATQFGWTALLGRAPGGADTSPYAAAARADDLAGLPATFIICGALDLFAEEDMEFAQRLIRAGVPTELHIYPGAPHGFMMAADAPVSKAFVRDSMNALARALT